VLNDRRLHMPHAQGSRQCYECQQAHVRLPSFHQANIVAMQFRHFGHEVLLVRLLYWVVSGLLIGCYVRRKATI
jgi:hypothetical protein